MPHTCCNQTETYRTHNCRLPVKLLDIITSVSCCLNDLMCLLSYRSIACLMAHAVIGRVDAYRNLHRRGNLGAHTKSSPTGPAEHDEGGSLSRARKGVSINLNECIATVLLLGSICTSVPRCAGVGLGVGLRSNGTKPRRSPTGSPVRPTMRRPREASCAGPMARTTTKGRIGRHTGPSRSIPC